VFSSSQKSLLCDKFGSGRVLPVSLVLRRNSVLSSLACGPPCFDTSRDRIRRNSPRGISEILLMSATTSSRSQRSKAASRSSNAHMTSRIRHWCGLAWMRCRRRSLAMVSAPAVASLNSLRPATAIIIPGTLTHALLSNSSIGVTRTSQSG
jgi:hypothetical protein